LSGALIWSDEFPRPSEPGGRTVWKGFAPRFLVAYRASITINEERVEFRPVWEQVIAEAPNWPGLRPERRGEKARHRHLAALRRESKCLEVLFKAESLEDLERLLPNDE
jgi:hypothetical protein